MRPHSEDFLAEGYSINIPPNGGDRHAGLTLRRVNEMLEEQSRRIAHAVHDEAGQLLAAVFIRLEQAARELPPDCGTCFQEIKQMLEMIEVQLREISHDLRPAVLDDLGLVPAFQCLTERVSKRYDLAIALNCSIPHRLPPAVETTLYRVVQESLTNAAKHAHAAHIEIRFGLEGDQVRGSIRDDGVGFDLNEVLARKGARGLGLLGIRERLESLGGTLSVHSQPGRGTELVIHIPRGTNAYRAAAGG
jgi:signal transduction histidine kinase